MAAPTITTSRLVLRPIEESDAEALHPVLSNSLTMRWWWHPPHQAMEETVAHVSDMVKMGTQLCCWAITANDGRALGWISLRQTGGDVANVGYILHNDHQGKGYVSEAFPPVIDDGFAAMGLRRIAAEVDPGNAASIKLLRKFGFRQEGLLRKDRETHERVRDALVFGMPCNAWKLA